MKTFKIYWKDLTKETQEKLYHFLGDTNKNYDIVPIAVLYPPDTTGLGFDEDAPM